MMTSNIGESSSSNVSLSSSPKQTLGPTPVSVETVAFQVNVEGRPFQTNDLAGSPAMEHKILQSVKTFRSLYIKWEPDFLAQQVHRIVQALEDNDVVRQTSRPLATLTFLHEVILHVDFLESQYRFRETPNWEYGVIPGASQVTPAASPHKDAHATDNGCSATMTDPTNHPVKRETCHDGFDDNGRSKRPLSNIKSRHNRVKRSTAPSNVASQDAEMAMHRTPLLPSNTYQTQSSRPQTTQQEVMSAVTSVQLPTTDARSGRSTPATFSPITPVSQPQSSQAKDFDLTHVEEAYGHTRPNTPIVQQADHGEDIYYHRNIDREYFRLPESEQEPQHRDYMEPEAAEPYGGHQASGSTRSNNTIMQQADYGEDRYDDQVCDIEYATDEGESDEEPQAYNHVELAEAAEPYNGHRSISRVSMSRDPALQGYATGGAVPEGPEFTGAVLCHEAIKHDPLARAIEDDPSLKGIEQIPPQTVRHFNYILGDQVYFKPDRDKPFHIRMVLKYCIPCSLTTGLDAAVNWTSGILRTVLDRFEYRDLETRVESLSRLMTTDLTHVAPVASMVLLGEKLSEISVIVEAVACRELYLSLQNKSEKDKQVVYCQYERQYLDVSELSAKQKEAAVSHWKKKFKAGGNFEDACNVLGLIGAFALVLRGNSRLGLNLEAFGAASKSRVRCLLYCVLANLDPKVTGWLKERENWAIQFTKNLPKDPSIQGHLRGRYIENMFLLGS